MIVKLYTEILKSLPIKEALKNLVTESDPEGTLIALAGLRLSGENFVDTIRANVGEVGLTTKEIEIVQKSILSMGQASTISITTRRERISEFNGQKTALRIIRKNLCTDNQRIALRLPLIMWPRGTLPRAKNCF